MDSWEDISWKPIQKCILPFVFPPFKRDTHKHPREPALLLRTVLWDLKSAFPWFSAQTFCAAAAHPRDPWVVSFCSFTPESASAARIDPASPQSLLFPLFLTLLPLCKLQGPFIIDKLKPSLSSTGLCEVLFSLLHAHLGWTLAHLCRLCELVLI